MAFWNARPILIYAGNLKQNLLPARGIKELEKHMKVLTWRSCRQTRRAVRQHLNPLHLLPTRPASYITTCQVRLLITATLTITAAAPLKGEKGTSERNNQSGYQIP